METCLRKLEAWLWRLGRDYLCANEVLDVKKSLTTRPQSTLLANWSTHWPTGHSLSQITLTKYWPPSPLVTWPSRLKFCLTKTIINNFASSFLLFIISHNVIYCSNKIFVRGVLAKPPTPRSRREATRSPPAPPYNNFKAININYQLLYKYNKS